MDGLWDFAYLGRNANWDDPVQEYRDTMAVPCAVDASPAYAGLRGLFAFRTRVAVTPGSRGRLRFDGLGMAARIMVDGEILADKALPYSGFWVEVPPSEKEEREVVLIIDNRFDKEKIRLQHQYFDFYAYAGIFRSVGWHEYDTYCLDRAVVREDGGVLKIGVGLHGDYPDNLDLSLSLNGEKEISFPGCPVSRNGKGPQIHLEVSAEGLARWSPESPRLHRVRISAGGDDLIERFGIRSLEIKNGRIHLDGRAVKLLGYNRHEAHPQFGPALPLQQIVQDIQILKDLGCNYVRGSHYPQDQRFLDLCDEKGILVMEESLAWQPQEEHFKDDEFCRLQEEQTRLMVRNSINHPSVIMWGFFNEGRSELDASVPVYKRLADAVREEDDSRFVTFASNHPLEELNFDLCDVINVNTYPGWYEDPECEEPLERIVPRIHSIMEHLKEAGQGEKPFIVSEIGAGAIYGWRDALNAHWSEGYQENFLERIISEVLKNDGINGISLWQFCDGRTYSSPRALSRPRAFNNKGLLDEYRRPKQAYQRVRELFRGYSDKG